MRMLVSMVKGLFVQGKGHPEILSCCAVVAAVVVVVT